MFTDSLAMEYRNFPHWRFLNFSPGIMDTGMQAQIREIPETQFPLVGQFKDYYSQAKLSMPEKVVAKLSRYIEKIDSGKTLTSELKIDLDVSDLA